MYTHFDEGEALRADLLQGVQMSMRLIRLTLDISGQELADYIGVTRQTINNFEKGHREIGIPYFLAFCGLLDEICRTDFSLKDQLNYIIKNNMVNKNYFSEDKTLLNQWFSTFAHLQNYYEHDFEPGEHQQSIEDELLQKAEYIYADASFFIHEKVADFLLRFSTGLEMHEKYLSVTTLGLNTLRNYKNESVGRNKVIAMAAYETLIKLSDKRLIDVIQTEDESEHILGIPVEDFSSEAVAILVGEDAKARKIAVAMQNNSIEGFLCHLDDYGNLVEWNL